MIASEHAVDPDAGAYVRELLGQPVPPRVATQKSIEIVHQYRVRCPQCGELPDSPYDSLVTARDVRRTHWADHRDERI